MDGRQFANIFSNLPLYCMLTCLCYLLHIFDESTYKFIFGGLVRSKHFFLSQEQAFIHWCSVVMFV
jgi:hypothetical protein